FRGCRLGADPRWGWGRSRRDRWSAAARLRRLVVTDDREERGGPARGETIAGAGARVGPGRGGVVGRFGSPDSVAGPSSRASVARRSGKPGYSSGPGAGVAGTSGHTP